MSDLKLAAQCSDPHRSLRKQSERMHGQLMLKRVKGTQITPALLQEHIPFGQGSRVSLQRAEIARVHRRQRKVQPTAAQRGSTAEKLVIVGRKNYGREFPNKVSQPRDAALLPLHFATLSRQSNRDPACAELLMFE